jgi:dihydroorotate dehydrogenase electron transfer subunit
LPSVAPRGAINREVTLVAREPLEGPYVLLSFRHPEIAAAARAGQFVMIKAGLSADPPLRRPFSILHVDPATETFALFIKTVGVGSAALAAMPVGERALCLGPLGRPFVAPPPGSEALLVAGGYGIAPFLLLSQEMLRDGRTPRLFYGGKSTSDLQLRERFPALGVPLVAATEDGSFGHRGRVTEALEAYLEASAGPHSLLACGPDAMLVAVARIAARRSLPAQVSLDPWMGCGVGTCLGCVVRIQEPDEPRPRYRCACTEGPVFDARTVVWHGEAASFARSQAVPA